MQPTEKQIVPATKSNAVVRKYWEAEPCGTAPAIVKDAAEHSREWFENVEEYRYAIEPFIHAVAQFTRYRGKKVLEVGVGAGTDHLQWARAGVDLFGVDLTAAGIETTRKRLKIYGLNSSLQQIDAESLPFPDSSFDVVYSWGVIHHSEHPQNIITEIRRVLRPGGRFIGMLYHRPSLVSLKVWFRHGLLAGKPWRSFADVLYHHVESIGTEAYTIDEVHKLFSAFTDVQVDPILTPHDTRRLPKFLTQFVPARFGWFLAINAQRQP